MSQGSELGAAQAAARQAPERAAPGVGPHGSARYSVFALALNRLSADEQRDLRCARAAAYARLPAA